MPKLPTYAAPKADGVISGGRMASADDFAAPDASGLAATVRRAGQNYIAATEEDESRKVLVRQAEIRAKYAKRLDEATVSSEDLGKIREELDNELSTVGDGLVTRKGAETAQLHAANTGAIFDNQANQIQVTRATLEARVAGASFLNSTGAIVASNPSYLPQAEKDVDAFMETLSKVPPAQRAVLAADLKQNLNVAAAMANARIDPEGTKRAVEGGSYTLTPEQRQQVIGRADAEVRAKRTDEAYKRADAEYQERERDEKARDTMFKGIMAGTVRARDVLDNPDLRPATREHLTLFIEQRAKALAGQEKKSNPTAVRDLWMRINAPDGTPGKIYNGDAIFEAVQAGTVNTTDANQLNNLVAGQRDANGRSFQQRLSGRMQTIIGSMRADPVYQAHPELAASIQLELVARLEKRSDDIRKAGQSPDSLLEPESKDYFFKPGTLKSVADDVKERQRALLPQPVDLRATPDQATSIGVGQPFVDPKGVTRVMTPQMLEVLKKAPTAAAVAAPEYESFVKSKPRSMSVEIDAPQKSLGRNLQGRTYGSREEALEALKALYK